MKQLVCIVMLGFFAGAGWAQVPGGVYRKDLDGPTVVKGFQCAKGHAWWYANGQLKSCTVAGDTDFGVARIPAGSVINLRVNGKPRSVFLKHDTDIRGYLCEGGNRLLGPSEGAVTEFYPSGSLALFWLAQAREIEGVPCAESGMFTGNSSVELQESGKLKACKLSRDFGGRKRGDRFVQAP